MDGDGEEGRQDRRKGKVVITVNTESMYMNAYRKTRQLNREYYSC